MPVGLVSGQGAGSDGPTVHVRFGMHVARPIGVLTDLVDGFAGHATPGAADGRVPVRILSDEIGRLAALGVGSGTRSQGCMAK